MNNKKRRSRGLGFLEMEINMTPMIDIVFQLLIFFVVTAKFIELEGELRSYLPKNRGLTPQVQTKIDLANVTMFLDWVGNPLTGHCIAITTKFRRPSGEELPRYQFPSVAWMDAFPSHKRGGTRSMYNCPDFNLIREYIRERKESYSGIGYGLPVTINFTDKVPIQMIVNMVDICVDLGITDFALNAQGID